MKISQLIGEKNCTYAFFNPLWPSVYGNFLWFSAKCVCCSFSEPSDVGSQQGREWLLGGAIKAGDLHSRKGQIGLLFVLPNHSLFLSHCHLSLLTFQIRSVVHTLASVRSGISWKVMRISMNRPALII